MEDKHTKRKPINKRYKSVEAEYLEFSRKTPIENIKKRIAALEATGWIIDKINTHKYTMQRSIE